MAKLILGTLKITALLGGLALAAVLSVWASWN